MNTIAREFPLAAVLSRQFQEFYCTTCFGELTNCEVLACDDCLEVAYCSLKCQRKDWNSVHQFECEILRSQNTPMTPTMQLCVRVLIQKFSGKTNCSSFNGASIDDLETNYKEFRSSPAHNQFLSDVLAIISAAGYSFLPEKLDTNKTIAVICSILCNSFGIIDEKRVEPIGTGLYVGMAKHNHSCAAKCHVVFEKNQVILRSPSDGYCKASTISYVSRMLPTFLRQKAIRNVHFITCRCEMCENHDLDSLALASRCQDRKCAGFVAGAKCNLCGKTEKFSYEQVCHSTKSLIDIIENFHSKHDQMDAVQEFHHLLKLREEFSEILADCNVAILQLDEQIAYCASNLNERSLPRNLEEIAVRGCESFVSRLSIGAPEVTRRLYIACKCISRLSTPLSDGILNFIKKAVESSEISHGAENTISMYLKEFYQNVSVL